jgi:6-pyruvoyltetrahydropterin/6-carboxytetrahydropterin synthase
MTYVISREIQFDAGHRVPNHNSKCKNPHGHRYKVEAVLRSEELITEPGHPQEGMLADFGFLKQALTECVHDAFDHGFIVWVHDDDLIRCFGEATKVWKIIPFPYIPTAENIARWSFHRLKIWFEDHTEDVYDFRLVQVRVWETPTSLAMYGEKGWNV